MRRRNSLHLIRKLNKFDKTKEIQYLVNKMCQGQPPISNDNNLKQTHFKSKIELLIEVAKLLPCRNIKHYQIT